VSKFRLPDFCQCSMTPNDGKGALRLALHFDPSRDARPTPTRPHSGPWMAAASDASPSCHNLETGPIHLGACPLAEMDT
jgi:hypothetical protein